jgi:inosine-uridine nucleoside N-ribohydrolase
MLFSSALVAGLALTAPVFAGRAEQHAKRHKELLSKRQVITGFPPKTWSGSEPRYTIMDNDYGSTAMIPFLIAMSGNMTVLGLTGDTANSWALQCSLHALALLEHGNLSCIPVALGQYLPFTMTEARFNAWTKAWGTLEWNGVFASENLTAEGLGNDPTSGDPSRISKSAFIEGYPNGSFVGQSAAQFMVEQVHKYPGKVSIYAAGSLTNIAAAVRLNSTFAKNAKELVIMGGYVDLNLQQVKSDFDQDLGSDINFIVDPEAAHIAVTADFPSITIAGNVANTIYLSNTTLYSITEKSPNLYSDLLKDYYLALPLWDEIAAAIMAFPELVTKSEEMYMDVSTAYDSPFYGGTYVWGDDFKPAHTRKVNYVLSINETMFFEKFNASMSHPPTCKNGAVNGHKY